MTVRSWKRIATNLTTFSALHDAIHTYIHTQTQEVKCRCRIQGWGCGTHARAVRPSMPAMNSSTVLFLSFSLSAYRYICILGRESKREREEHKRDSKEQIQPPVTEQCSATSTLSYMYAFSRISTVRRRLPTLHVCILELQRVAESYMYCFAVKSDRGMCEGAVA